MYRVVKGKKKSGKTLFVRNAIYLERKAFFFIERNLVSI